MAPNKQHQQASSDKSSGKKMSRGSKKHGSKSVGTDQAVDLTHYHFLGGMAVDKKHSDDVGQVSTTTTTTKAKKYSHDHYPVTEPSTEGNERTENFYPKVLRAMQIKPAFPKQGRGRWTNIASYRVRVPNGPLAQVFYPCAKLGHFERKKYTGKYLRTDVAAGIAAYTKISPVVLSMLVNKKHHVFNQAPPHPQLVHRATGKVPVVIFSHGLGGNADIYSVTCKDLASQGYVVWAIEHEDMSASFARTESGAIIEHGKHTNLVDWATADGQEFDPDNKDHVTEQRGPQLAKRVKEIDAVMACIRDPIKAELIRVTDTSLGRAQLPNAEERFKSVLCLMDPSKVVLAGHSFGAASCALATKSDHGFVGLILLDIWSHPLENKMLDDDVSIPTISIVSDAFSNNAFTECTRRLLRDNSSAVEAYVLSGCPHHAFSDPPFFFPVWMGKRTHNIGTTGRVIVREAISDLSAQFLKKHIKNPTDTLPVETPMVDQDKKGRYSVTVLDPARADLVSKSWAKLVSPFVFKV